MSQKVSENARFCYPEIPGVSIFAGTDEAGRGPLVGNVVAGAVILDPARPISGLRDSKKLSGKKREEQSLPGESDAIPETAASGIPGEEVNRRIVSSLRSWSGKETDGSDAPPAPASDRGGSAEPAVGIPVREKNASVLPEEGDSAAKSGKSGKSRKKPAKGGTSEAPVSGSADGDSLEKLISANPEFRET